MGTVRAAHTKSLPPNAFFATRLAYIVSHGTNACAPCHAIQYKLDEWQKTHPEVETLYVPLEQFPALAAEEGIFAAPTLLFFVEGKLTLRESGYFSLSLFLERAERYVNLL